MLVAIFALCLVFCATPKAEAATVASGSCGTGVTWKLSDTGTLSVSGSGAMADYDSSLSSVPWRNYLGSIKTITFSSGVTHIGNYAFAGCVYAKTITIGTGVQTIGEGAFMACISVTSLNIPKAVTTIGAGAFAQCESLASCIYQVDAKLTTIETMAFYDCYALKRVKLPYSTRYIGIAAYENCIALNELYIQKGVEFIGDRAFLQCTALTKVEIPATATYVGGAAFGYCSALTQITATSGGNFVAINNWLYNEEKTVLVQALPSITGSCTMDMPATVTTIGPAAFAGTKGMTSVTIPDTVTTIDEEAFTNCSGLTSVTLPKKLETLAKGAFYSCSSLTSISLPHNFAHIGEGAFEGCSSLKTVEFGDSITAIGNDAFKNCYKLQSITIPDTVNYVGHRAFYGCSGLTNVVFSTSVVFIGEGVVSQCSSLKTVTFLGDAPHFDEKAFFEKTIKVLYLADNTTWTEEVCQNYSGTVIWLAVPDLSYVNGGSCGENVRWWLKDDGTMIIYGSGDMATYIGWYEDKAVKKLVVEQGVTSISEQAFRYGKITSVVLPESVTTIGNQAFMDCKSLETVTMSSSVVKVGKQAFDNTPWAANLPAGPTYLGKVLYIYKEDGATQYTVRDGTYSISDSAFKGNTTLKSVVLPQDLQYIHDQAFYGCTALESIVIPDSVQYINGHTFYCCTSLKNVTIGSGVKDIGLYAFYGCSAIQTLKLPESVESIGNDAFYGCKNLKSINIPSKVTKIAAETFYGCSALTTLTLGDQITEIEASAFINCGFTSFRVPDGVNYIREYAFSGCRKLKTIDFGKNLKYIGMSAFKNCVSLTTVRVPDTVKEVSFYAFEKCSALKTVDFGNSVTKIGRGVIENSPNVTKVTIPASVTEMNSAFRDCTGLKEVIFEGSAPEYANDAFEGVTLTAYYPAGDATWTESKRKTFDGAVTWIPYEKQEVEKFDIDVARMILGNSLEFQFGVAMNKFTDTTGYYAVVEKSGVTKTIPATQWSTAGQYYAIVYDGLAAKEMADTISVTIYNAQGEALSNQKTDSVRDYAARAFDSQDAAGKTMLVDMLNYGAAAQLNFGYNTEDLANNQLTDQQRSMATAGTPEMSNDLQKGQNYTGSRFVLESRIQVQIAFSGLTEDMYAIYTYTNNYGQPRSVRVEGKDFLIIGGKPAGVELSELVYADARTAVQITVYNADGTVHGTATDSIESCALRSGGDVFVALMKFADSAKTYLYG